MTVLILVLTSQPGWAEPAVEWITEIEVKTGQDEPKRVLERVLADETRIRLDLYDGHDPDGEPASTLISTDGGETFVLLDRDEALCSAYSLQEFFEVAGRRLQGVRKLANVQVGAEVPEKILDETGPDILGMPTRHLRIRSRLDTSAQLLWFRFTYDLEVMDDVWIAEGVEIPQPMLRYLNGYAETGFADTDRQLGHWLTFLDGLPLKVVSHVTLIDLDDDEKREKTETYEIAELRWLEADEVDATRFVSGPCEPVSRSVMREEATRLMLDLVR